MNIAEYLDQFYGNMSEPNTNRFPIERVKTWIYEVERKWSANEDIKPVFKNTYVDVSNERLYSFPSDIVNKHIDDIYFKFANNDTYTRLVPKDLKTIEQEGYDWQSYTGDPSWWYVDFHLNKYGFYRYPIGESAGNQLIQLHYRGMASKLNRYYTTGTATFTNGSATVTGSGTSWSTELEAGDEIGYGALLSRTVNFPNKFYTISSVDGDTQITLTESFAESTQSGVNYIGAQVSDIDIVEINYAVRDWVIGAAMFKDGKPADGQAMQLNAKNQAIDFMTEYKRIEASREPAYPDLTAGRAPRIMYDYGFHRGDTGYNSLGGGYR